MKKETLKLLRFISSNPGTSLVDNNKKFDWDPETKGIGLETHSNKWSFDKTVIELKRLGYIIQSGSARPTFSSTPAGEVFLQGEKNTRREIIIGLGGSIGGAVLTACVTWLLK